MSNIYIKDFLIKSYDTRLLSDTSNSRKLKDTLEDYDFKAINAWHDRLNMQYCVIIRGDLYRMNTLRDTLSQLGWATHDM